MTQPPDVPAAIDLAGPDDEIDDYSNVMDVEAQLLCSLLWAPADRAAGATAAMTRADFYRPVHAELFTVIADLLAAGTPHNGAYVLSTLQQAGRTGGQRGKQLTTVLTDITTIGIPSDELEHYVGAGHCQVVWCAVVFGHSEPSHRAVGQAARVCSVT